MAKEPEIEELSIEAEVPAHFEDVTQAAFVAPAPWEAEIEVFWQNVLLNVSNRVETPIHNFLHEEKEALKARLKAIL